MELYSPHWMRLVLPSFSFLTHFFFRLMVERVAWFSQPTVSCSSPSLASLLLSTPRMSSTPFGEDLEHQWKITKHPKSTILKPMNGGPRKAWNWKWRALSKWRPKSRITVNQIVICNWIKSDDSILEPPPCRQDVKAKAVTKISANSGRYRPHSKLW